ncbi:hypothetical protein [Nocardioides limicola]|uniref:hypothetical protein n=1 Tax=Nocardioides limicola TaxID=2803368 RepID=UPI00193B482E|nr:hypothetical protein [Nocardioides sp. DJM-14]
MNTEWNSINAFTGGDRVEAAQLTKALEAIRDNIEDREVARAVASVLQGQRTLRELTRDPAFVTAAAGAMEELSAQWEEMTPEERVRLAEQGKRETEALREDLGMDPEIDAPEIGLDGPALGRPERPSDTP